MQVLLSFFLFLVFFANISAAETLYLKDGKSITGKIVSQDPYVYIIEVGGSPQKIYRDQVSRVEEKQSSVVKSELNIDNTKFITISQKKMDLIIYLLEINGTYASLKKNLEQVIAQSPSEREIELRRILDLKGMVENLIPIYDKYYSEQELQDLINFYQGSLGSKMLEVTPKIIQESVEANLKFFQEKIKEIQTLSPQ